MKMILFALAAALITSQAMAETGDSPEVEAVFFGYDDAADQSGMCQHVHLMLAQDQTLWVKLSDQFVAYTADKNLRALYQKGRDEFERKLAKNGKAACSAAGASAAYRSAFYK